MIKCVIVEDEPASAERLMLLLERNHSEDIRVERWLKSPNEVLNYLSVETPELVFFDVEIHDSTAFELLAQLPKVDFAIIFTTAHQKYAIQAIKVSALDYLLKPIDAADLASAIRRVNSIDGESQIRKQLAHLIEAYRGSQLPTKIAIPTVFGTEYIPVSEIVRCQADINYTHFFLTDGRKLTVAKTLKEFERVLEPHRFFRVHNSHLVNLRLIRFYNKGKGGFLVLEDGAEIEVASRRKDALAAILATI